MAERRSGTIGIWVVAALLAAFAVVRLAGRAEEAPDAGVRIERGPGGAAGAAGGAEAAGASQAGGGASGRAGAIYVHVAGAVRRPGLVQVPPGSRVAAAVERAGGPLARADLTLVNLAARVDDGQQVVVPAAAGTPGAAGASAAAPGIKPSLGSATVDQLEEIDGIGPTLAERIVEYRTENGGFSSLEALNEVDGIGDKRLDTLREALQP